LLAPFESGSHLLRDFKRRRGAISASPEKTRAVRALAKLKIAHGFMVYEGLS